MAELKALQFDKSKAIEWIKIEIKALSADQRNNKKILQQPHSTLLRKSEYFDWITNPIQSKKFVLSYKITALHCLYNELKGKPCNHRYKDSLSRECDVERSVEKYKKTLSNLFGNGDRR